jgi:hypothetical protein
MFYTGKDNSKSGPSPVQITGSLTGVGMGYRKWEWQNFQAGKWKLKREIGTS